MQDSMMSQNIIITERCRSLRQLGRNALRGKWRNGIMATFIYILVMTVPQVIFDNLFGMNMATLFTNDGFTYNMDAEFYQEMYNSIPQMSALSAIWLLLITGAMQLGLMIYFLASFRGHNVVPKDVFLGFERFGKALGLLLFQALFIYLWTMLFIIPGIIAAIRYSQAFFVMADDPNKSIRQCMDESKSMMRGNKMKYFLLMLSFIGWMILCTLPGGFLSGIVNTLTSSTVAAAAVSVISSLFMAPVYTYVFSTCAGFYEILAGHLIKETEPAPLAPEQIDVNAPVEKIEEMIEEVEMVEAGKAAETELLPEAEVQQLDAPAPQTDAKAGTPLDANAAGTPEANAAAAPEAGSPGTQPAQKQPAGGQVAGEEILPEPLNEEDKYND